MASVEQSVKIFARQISCVQGRQTVGRHVTVLQLQNGNDNNDSTET